MDTQAAEQKYSECCSALKSLYLELLGDYKSKVKDGHSTVLACGPLERELEKLERDMLRYPPLTPELLPDGSFSGRKIPRKKGLTVENRLPQEVFRPFGTHRGGTFTTIPSSQWAGLISGQDAVNLRDFVPEGQILDQDGVGSCASESMSGCIMASRVKAGMEPVKLNPWFAYYTVSGGYDGGSSLSDNVAFALKNGVASQRVWSRSEGWRKEPSSEAYADAKQYRLLEAWTISDWEEFGTAVLLGFPVYFGYSGHAIWCSSLVDSSRLVYCNSWGDWGDGGFGTLSKNSIAWGYGAYAFRVVTQT